MEFLSNTWVLWLVLCAAFLVGMVLYRQTRRNVTAVYTSSADFSVRTIFFSFRKGDADLFLGLLAAMISFSLFVAGIVRWVQIALT